MYPAAPPYFGCKTKISTFLPFTLSVGLCKDQRTQNSCTIVFILISFFHLLWKSEFQKKKSLSCKNIFLRTNFYIFPLALEFILSQILYIFHISHLQKFLRVRGNRQDILKSGLLHRRWVIKMLAKSRLSDKENLKLGYNANLCENKISNTFIFISSIININIDYILYS